MRQRGAAEPELPINRWRELVPSSRDRKCYEGEKEEGEWVGGTVGSKSTEYLRMPNYCSGEFLSG